MYKDDNILMMERYQESIENDFLDKRRKSKGYTIGPVYHGTPEHNFNVFDDALRGSGPITGNPIANHGIFFTPDIDITSTYSGDGGRILTVFLSLHNPKTYEMFVDGAKLADDTGIASKEKVDAYIKSVKNAGYDGLVLTMDGIIREYMVFNKNQVKLADAVTYEDNGDVIPLEQRFDSTKNDIRY